MCREPYREFAVGESGQGIAPSALGAVGDEPRLLRLKKHRVTGWWLVIWVVPRFFVPSSVFVAWGFLFFGTKNNEK